jgi:hypothetical protein
MGPFGSGAPRVRSMGCLTWQCRGTPVGGGEDVLILLHDLIHLLFSCRGALSGGHGHSLSLSLRANHRENKFPGLRNELTALFCSNQRDGGRRCYLWYLVQLIAQSDNKSTRPRLIHGMSLPQVWLA